MAKAKDYDICCGVFKPYIAKMSKGNGHEMTDDRREITDGEILMLIAWFVENRIKGEFTFKTPEGKAIRVGYVPEENVKEGKDA